MDRGLRPKVPGLVLAAGLLTAACLVASAFGDSARVALRYERVALEAGQWWRLLSGHLVHLGWSHTVLNVVALLLVAGIFAPVLRALEGLVVIAAAALAIDLGLYAIDPEVDWYVGLSGVLHGLFAAGTLALAAHDRRFALALGAALCIKLGIEMLGGPLTATAALTGGDVVTEAHLYGSLGGAAAYGLLRAIGTRRPRPV